MHRGWASDARGVQAADGLKHAFAVDGYLRSRENVDARTVFRAVENVGAEEFDCSSAVRGDDKCAALVGDIRRRQVDRHVPHRHPAVRVGQDPEVRADAGEHVVHLVRKAHPLGLPVQQPALAGEIRDVASVDGEARPPDLRGRRGSRNVDAVWRAVRGKRPVAVRKPQAHEAVCRGVEVVRPVASRQVVELDLFVCIPRLKLHVDGPYRLEG